MATYTILKLTSITPVHLGTGKENYDFSSSDLQSDTISSALTAMRAQQGKTDDLEEFLGSFKVSSAFPFYKGHLFMPLPKSNLSIDIQNEEPASYRKILKKLKYADVSLWKKLIKGDRLIVSPQQIRGEYLFEEATDLPTAISRVSVAERVKVSSLQGMDSEPFFFEWKYFNPEAGLFFLTDAKGQLLEELVHLLKTLGETGIGTDKSIGGGHFDVQQSGEFTIDEEQNAHAKMLLSLYIPKEDEIRHINLKHSSFSILLRGGFIAGSNQEKFRHLRKKSIYMFDVGSVMDTEIQMEGKIVDLCPDWDDADMHPIFRSGRPIYIPITMSI